MIAALLLAGGLLAPADSLTGPGVSHALAIYRSQHVRGVHYDLSLDVTRRDTAVGRARIDLTRVGGGDVILDFRGYALENVRANGAPVPASAFNRAHLRVPATQLKDGANVIEASFRAPIAPAGASV